MATKLDRVSLYIPERKRSENLMARLQAVADQKDRSINYIVVEAIQRYVEDYEKQAK